MKTRDYKMQALDLLINTLSDRVELNQAIERVKILKRSIPDAIPLFANENTGYQLLISKEIHRINNYLCLIGIEKINDEYKLTNNKGVPFLEQQILTQQQAVLLFTACHDVEAELYSTAALAAVERTNNNLTIEDIQELQPVMSVIRDSSIVQLNLPILLDAIQLSLQNEMLTAMSNNTDTESTSSINTSPEITPRPSAILEQNQQPPEVVNIALPVVGIDKRPEPISISTRLYVDLVSAILRLNSKIEEDGVKINRNPNGLFTSSLKKKMAEQVIKRDALQNVVNNYGDIKAAGSIAQELLNDPIVTKGLITQKTKTLLEKVVIEAGLLSGKTSGYKK
jgi:hypothetical protein